MRRSRVTFACVVMAVTLIAPRSVAAQAPDAQALQQEIAQLRQQLATLQQQYDARLAALQLQVETLAAGQAPATPGVATDTPPAAGPPVTAAIPAAVGGGEGTGGVLPTYGAPAGASKVFNPDIAVIGDILGAAGSNAVNETPAIEMHEAEASFQAIVDPYARADVFLAFGHEGVDIEEGFLTFPAVPGGLLVKVGKQRAAFGKVNTLHNHTLPWTDRPLVTTNLVGGEEGISDAGISVARLIPNPWIFLEATGQVYRGEVDGLFESRRRSDLAYVARLRGYHDLTENTNVDLGVSWARGQTASPDSARLDADGFATRLVGMDATVRWRPLQRSIYRSFIGRSELVWSHRDDPVDLAGVLGRATRRAFGYYVSGDYQFARRWATGVRYDWSDRADTPWLRDSGQSLLLTYSPSEFSQIRGQYRRTDYAQAATANEFLFQFQFSIGAHGAHPF